eukprot:tig00020556_g11049.t1
MFAFRAALRRVAEAATPAFRQCTRQFRVHGAAKDAAKESTDTASSASPSFVLALRELGLACASLYAASALIDDVKERIERADLLQQLKQEIPGFVDSTGRFSGALGESVESESRWKAVVALSGSAALPAIATMLHVPLAKAAEALLPAAAAAAKPAPPRSALAVVGFVAALIVTRQVTMAREGLREQPKELFNFTADAVDACAAAPIAHEIFFRGLVMRRLIPAVGLWPALLASTLLSVASSTYDQIRPYQEMIRNPPTSNDEAIVQERPVNVPFYTAKRALAEAASKRDWAAAWGAASAAFKASTSESPLGVPRDEWAEAEADEARRTSLLKAIKMSYKTGKGDDRKEVALSDAKGKTGMRLAAQVEEDMARAEQARQQLLQHFAERREEQRRAFLQVGGGLFALDPTGGPTAGTVWRGLVVHAPPSLLYGTAFAALGASLPAAVALHAAVASAIYFEERLHLAY